MKSVRQRKDKYSMTSLICGNKKKTNKNQKQIHRYLENIVVVPEEKAQWGGRIKLVKGINVWEQMENK